MMTSINAKMTTSPGMYQFIRNSEGLRLKAYLIPGETNWTVGYGHSDQHVQANQIIDKNTAENLLKRDILAAEAVLRVFVKVALKQWQWDALISLVFNIGSGLFMTSTLLNKLNEGKFDEIPTQIKRWCHNSQGMVVEGLELRRKKEAAIFENTENWVRSFYDNQNTEGQLKDV